MRRLLLATLLFLGAHAYADTVTLKDGTELQGTILQVTDSVIQMHVIDPKTQTKAYRQLDRQAVDSFDWPSKTEREEKKATVTAANEERSQRAESLVTEFKARKSRVEPSNPAGKLNWTRSHERFPPQKGTCRMPGSANSPSPPTWGSIRLASIWTA